MPKYVAVHKPKFIWYVENQEKYMKKMLKFYKNTKQKNEMSGLLLGYHTIKK